jgi:carbon-monoxide dehydrogenase medium subunit
MIQDFVYSRAKTVKEALDLIEKHKDDCKIVCGGQSLLILMRQGLVAPANLIDIKGIDELKYIKFQPKEGLKIGAGTTHSEIQKSSQIKKHYPLLIEMEENLASVQTRNWGTIGGNLSHADPAGDPGPVFIALNAMVKVANKERERAIPLEEFFIDYFETALEEGELLLEVQLPVVPPKTATVYEKFNIIKNDQGIVSVASTPIRARKAEKLLIGQRLDDGLLEKIGKKASEEADPVADIHASEEYRRYLVKALTKRMVKKAWERAKIIARKGGL